MDIFVSLTVLAPLFPKPELRGDRFAGLNIRQRRFTKSVVFAAKFFHLPNVPTPRVLKCIRMKSSRSLLSPRFYRMSKFQILWIYGQLKMDIFDLEMYPLLLVQFPRFYSKFI